jgi:HrpA-like RNA helicase
MREKDAELMSSLGVTALDETKGMSKKEKNELRRRQDAAKKARQLRDQNPETVSISAQICSELQLTLAQMRSTWASSKRPCTKQVQRAPRLISDRSLPPVQPSMNDGTGGVSVQKVQLSEGQLQTSAQLLEQFKEQQRLPLYQAMQSKRSKLPAHGMQQQVVDAIRQHQVSHRCRLSLCPPTPSCRLTCLASPPSLQVVVISGETGCGKTTQVPQFVLDAAILSGEGAGCNIVCTQPRRISAIGVAERVASERAQRIGDEVGYQIRLERRCSDKTRLLFCTTGILLRRLQVDPMLAGTSHVLLDEVDGNPLNVSVEYVSVVEYIR